MTTPLRLRRTQMPRGALLPRSLPPWLPVGAGSPRGLQRGTRRSTRGVDWGRQVTGLGRRGLRPGRPRCATSAATWAASSSAARRGTSSINSSRAGSRTHPVPAPNAAFMALFRYRTRCGTVLGHTGSIPAGYSQFVGSTPNGKLAKSNFTITVQLAEKILGALRAGRGAGGLRRAGRAVDRCRASIQSGAPAPRDKQSVPLHLTSASWGRKRS